MTARSKKKPLNFNELFNLFDSSYTPSQFSKRLETLSDEQLVQWSQTTIKESNTLEALLLLRRTLFTLSPSRLSYWIEQVPEALVTDHRKGNLLHQAAYDLRYRLDHQFMTSLPQLETLIPLLLKKVPTALDALLDNGYSPLHLAVYFNLSDYVDLLLKSGAICDIISPDGETPLHHACFTGNKPMLTQLLKAKADPTRSTNENLNALHFVCKHGDIHMAKQLVDAGCPINLISHTDKETPLDWATYYQENPDPPRHAYTVRHDAVAYDRLISYLKTKGAKRAVDCD